MEIGDKIAARIGHFKPTMTNRRTHFAVSTSIDECFFPDLIARSGSFESNACQSIPVPVPDKRIMTQIIKWYDILLDRKCKVHILKAVRDTNGHLRR